MALFNKILIANRGEIACRVIATAKRMGIKTVSVYSDADANAKHVSMADEAVHIGSSTVAESYLVGDKILKAAQDTGAEAIHPGYGFLSENPSFVEAVEAAGLVFIGPSSNSIKAMGLKDAAKALMVEAGVPVVPGYHGENQDLEFLSKEAEKIGYPVLIKARAGGGGKGMRLVEKPEDFAPMLEAAQREGQASFGDPLCLIEKYIVKPRHIEIQVFGDEQGNVVYLFERDCSLQRRHQKVIEEAPAPGMSQKVREAMGKAAVNAAKAVNYAGAGTVEFIVDGSQGLREDGFWFMEMNTRLQVEHPVSEAITGFDFVELQILVAAGQPLPFTQEDLSINGWSFEARIYAEDVPKGFLPSTGVLKHLRFPIGQEFAQNSIRIDSGVREGDEISSFYDPMIAKIIVHGSSREVALNSLSVALSECHVSGTTTNIEFLHALANHQGFGKGDVDTDLIARDIDELTRIEIADNNVTAIAAISALGLLKNAETSDVWMQYSGWQHWGSASYYTTLQFGETILNCKVTLHSKNEYVVVINDEELSLTLVSLEDTKVKAVIGNKTFYLDAYCSERTVAVFKDGFAFQYSIHDALEVSSDEDAGGDVLSSPMPGLVTKVVAKAGDHVSQGDPILMIEAMKMEHTMMAPRDGVLEEVFVSVGDQIMDGTLLLKMQEPSEA